MAMSKMINPAESCQRRRQTEELTELELGNITGGSQSTGAGAGKVTFNPFSITKRVDKASPVFFL
jgi:type VI protein secretion system component Hcp